MYDGILYRRDLLLYRRLRKDGISVRTFFASTLCSIGHGLLLVDKPNGDASICDSLHQRTAPIKDLLHLHICSNIDMVVQSSGIAMIPILSMVLCR